ncbi:MAG: RNA ligase family protein [Cyanobacteria bacterium P01_F01_bin.150]
MMQQIHKYPRTPHIEGSRLQPGDEDLDSLPFRAIAQQYVVIEEKVDGANAAISFDANGQLQLQSRGHYLVGGEREKHFNLFKQWANTHVQSLWNVLGHRYILYGEWLYAKHTVFYDALPHYFLEYDLLDLESGQFLNTRQRHQRLANIPICSVPILFSGVLSSYKQMVALLGQSHFINAGHIERLRQACEQQGVDVERSLHQTDPSSLMEGLYIKVENDDWTLERYKYVRASFLTTVLQSDSHWLNRPIIPNQLRAGVDLFDL